MYICAIIAVPENVVLFEKQNLNLKTLAGLNITENEKNFTKQVSTNFGNKVDENLSNKKLSLKLFNTIDIKEINVDIVKETSVIPLGNAIGMKLYTKGVLVVGMSQINNENGENMKPYENSGIEEGDTIISVNGEKVQNTEELVQKVNSSNGENVKIEYMKNNEIKETSIKPVKSDNIYKIGLWVRDTQAGVGTATFYEPSTNKFMTLGHGITDIDTGQVVNISNGKLTKVNILSIIKGQKGKPGEILGSIEENSEIGDIEKNTTFGVYGNVTNKSKINIESSKEMKVASREEIKEGEAEILCEINNEGVKSYKIEIKKVYTNNNANNKSMLIKIMDEKLLNATGGIVQGMSGAPIIQNGKFIGAVTCVLVNDPQEGYGVFGDILIKKMRETN